MRNKIIVAVFGAAWLLLPVVSSADTLSDLQAKLQSLREQVAQVEAAIKEAQAAAGSSASVSVNTSAAGTAGERHFTPPYCIQIVRQLALGASGDDVTKLQQFLSDAGAYSGPVTGYFGSLTVLAIQKIQAEQGIVSSGDAATTGYGAVGPSTRALLSSLCGGGAGSGVSTSGTAGSLGSGAGAVSIDKVPTVSLSASSLTSESLTPTLKGTAAYTTAVSVTVRQNGVVRYDSGLISVSDNAWSVTLSALEAGSYQVSVRSARGNAVANGVLTIGAAASSDTGSSLATETSASSDTSSTAASGSSSSSSGSNLSAILRVNGSPNGASVARGGNAYLSWSTTGARSCTVSSSPSSDVSGASGTNGSPRSTGALSQTTTFTITCTGEDGTSTSKSVTITVPASVSTPVVSNPGGSSGTTRPGVGSGYACTQDVMQCPDGHYVSRTGPSCTFASCTSRAQ